MSQIGKDIISLKNYNLYHYTDGLCIIYTRFKPLYVASVQTEKKTIGKVTLQREKEFWNIMLRRITVDYDVFPDPSTGFSSMD